MLIEVGIYQGKRMGKFLYSCHIQKINNGELKRAAGIIERYLDLYGNTAITS